VANEQHLHVSLKGVKDVFNLVFGEHVIAEPGHTKGRKVQVNNCAGNCVVSSAHNDTTHGTCEQTTHTPQFKTHKRIRPQDEVSDGSTGTKEMRTASAQNTKQAQTTTTIHGVPAVNLPSISNVLENGIYLRHAQVTLAREKLQVLLDLNLLHTPTPRKRTCHVNTHTLHHRIA
jgi:hypothetical protein